MTLIPPNITGAAFGVADDGDGRTTEATRLGFSRRIGAPADWAWVKQVHGADTIGVTTPGDHGEADALFTTTPDLALVVATADCVPVILEGRGGVGIAHAGWRGAAAGVVAELRFAMEGAGIRVERAAIGPAIGPCCFEVGPEVAARFPEHGAETTWGTTSVDLAGAIAGSLAGLDVWVSGACTVDDDRFWSHRRDGTRHRQVSVVWLRG